MKNGFSRPLGKSVLGFLGWATLLLLGLGTVDRLIAGRGLTGIFEVLFGFLWLGWIFVVGALPVWLVFRWSLAKAGARLRGSPPFRGALIGVLVWTCAGGVLLVAQLLAWTFSPDSRPTVGSVLMGLAAVAHFGGLLGYLEGRAIGKYLASSAGRERVTFADAD
jgi:hypothetical protein